MSDSIRTLHVRIRHALRCAVGGSILTAVGLTAPFTNGCFSVVLFSITTIAGTSENYQGFQLRSASLTFTGALLGLLSYAIVVVIASSSQTATFLLTLPFIALFSALRPAVQLMPLPPVAIVTLGLNIISQFGNKCVHDNSGRACLPANLLRIFIDSFLAWLVSNFVNFLFPDRASDVGRLILSRQLCRAGSLISAIAGNALSTPRHPKLHSAILEGQSGNRHTARYPDEPPFQCNKNGLPLSSVALNMSSFPKRTSSYEQLASLNNYINRHCIEESNEMVHAACVSLSFLQDLPPIGSTRVEDYSFLSKARSLLDMAAYELQLFPESRPRWRNVTAWPAVIDAISTLLNKISCLESVIEMSRARNQFLDHAHFAQFVGEAYMPLWVLHFAVCATSCANLSNVLLQATCDHLTSKYSSDGLGKDFAEADPTWWRSRRAEMYFGFLFHSRLLARIEGPQEANLQTREVRNLETACVKALDLQFSLQLRERRMLQREDPQKQAQRLDERRALAFFAIESHALAEEIGHLSSAISQLSQKSNTRGWCGPFFFLFGAFPLLKTRALEIIRWKLHGWEVQYIFTHSLMLSCILALALFLPIPENGFFGQTEVAWAFISASLSAQLSVEPTLLVSVWRIIATVAGVAFGFGFSYILRQIEGSHCAIAHLWIVPYMFVIIFIFIATANRTLRYPSFLIVVTNAVMLLCPRSGTQCSIFYNQSCQNCHASWRYAIARAVNVSIGVVFAFVFHVLFWPRYANGVAMHKLCKAFQNAPRVMRRLRLKFFSFGLERDPSFPKHASITTLKGRENFPVATLSRDSEFKADNYGGYIFETDLRLLEHVKENVQKHVLSAITILKSDARAFQSGPLRLKPLLPKLEKDFIALAVTLSEQAAVLGRRPVFSPSYGRIAFDKLIQPMLRQYELIQISLNNLVGVVRTVLEQGEKLALEDARELAGDLGQAVAHLARCRSELRIGVRRRAQTMFQLCELDVNVRQRLSQWSDPSTSNQFETSHVKVRAVDDMEDNLKCKRLHMDDIILYDAFTFVAEGCLSAFVRIALIVLQNFEQKLSAEPTRHHGWKVLVRKSKRS